MPRGLCKPAVPVPLQFLRPEVVTLAHRSVLPSNGWDVGSLGRLCLGEAGRLALWVSSNGGWDADHRTGVSSDGWGFRPLDMRIGACAKRRLAFWKRDGGGAELEGGGC